MSDPSQSPNVPTGQGQPQQYWPPQGQGPQPPYTASPYAPGPYGQQAPYGQPAQSPYGQPTQNPYPQQAPHPYAAAQQGYPAAQQGGNTYAPAQPVARNPVLGWFALIAIVVATVAGAAVSYVLSAAYGRTLMDLGFDSSMTTNPSALAENPAFIAFAENNAGLGNTILLASLVGIAAWITAIVAVATRRGRTPGVWGIVLGILAPILIIIAAVVGLMPFLQGL